MSSFEFKVKGQSMSATKEQVITKMKGVVPDSLRALVVKVGGITYPVKQVFSEAFNVDKADFISHQARSVLKRLGFEVSRVKDGEEGETLKNQFGVQVMTWVGVVAETNGQALSLAHQYTKALSERQWEVADRLVEIGSVTLASVATQNLELWNDPPTWEQIEVDWEGHKWAEAQGTCPNLEDTSRVAHITAWQKVHEMPAKSWRKNLQEEIHATKKTEMDNVWNCVMTLKGATLHTISQKKPFVIVDVLSDRVKFVPNDGKGGERWFPRKSMEYLWSLGLNLETISPKDIKEVFPDDQNTSYVAAILREIVKA